MWLVIYLNNNILSEDEYETYLPFLAYIFRDRAKIERIITYLLITNKHLPAHNFDFHILQDYLKIDINTIVPYKIIILAFAYK